MLAFTGPRAAARKLRIILLITSMVMMLSLQLTPVYAATLTVGQDKTEYNKGETVYITGTLTNGGSPIVGADIAIEVKNDLAVKVFEAQVKTTDTGAFSTSLAIPDSFRTGQYTIYAAYQSDRAQSTFTIVANSTPTAFIDSISPNPASQGQYVTLTGHGTDTDGSIVGYNWRSSIDGQLSTSASFNTYILSVGTHTIYFKVRDNAGAWSTEVSGTLTINSRAHISVPSSNLVQNLLGRVFFLFNNKKYYITNPAAFSSYGFNWADVKSSPNPDSFQSSQIYYDYLLDGKMPLPNKPYIAGDVNDGSLYYIPYYTWGGEKYPISWAGYNAYSGLLKALPIRYGDPAMSLPSSSTILDGVNPIPSAIPLGHVIGKNPLNRVFFIFNNKKYYFTDWPIYLGYGFTNSDINPSVNPDNYPSAQVNFDYLLEDTTSVFRKPLPNQPYIAGDVNDGSLYWTPYYTWMGEKYPISGAGYNGYGGQLKTMHTRFGDPSINMPTSTYLLNGINPIPVVS